MILSNRHRFVFIKTRKTASTSLEIFFSHFCGDDDIVTPITSQDEIVRYDLNGCLPQRFSSSPSREKRYREAIRNRDPDRVRQSLNEQDLLFRNHMSLSEIKRLIAIPDDYLVISSDRHPYEKVVSMTYFRLRNKGVNEAAFVRELEKVIDSGKYRNIGMYHDHRGLLATRVIRYENLLADTRSICNELDLEFSEQLLPRTKANFRNSREDAVKLLTGAQKQRIARVCGKEFKLYGYRH